MKISFDFDGTLSQESIQALAEHLINIGDEVWIVTSRVARPEWNKDLFSVADYLGIPRSRIFFTGGGLKRDFLDENGFDIHFDDDIEEVVMCKKCKAIQVYDTFEDNYHVQRSSNRV